MCLTPLKRQRLDICFKLFEILVPVDNGDAETNVHLASVFLLACVVVMASLPYRCRHSIGLPSRLRRRHGVVGVEDDPPRVPEKKCQPRFEEFEKFSDISAKSVSVLY